MPCRSLRHPVFDWIYINRKPSQMPVHPNTITWARRGPSLMYICCTFLMTFVLSSIRFIFSCFLCIPPVFFLFVYEFWCLSADVGWPLMRVQDCGAGSVRPPVGGPQPGQLQQWEGVPRSDSVRQHSAGPPSLWPPAGRQVSGRQVACERWLPRRRPGETSL